MTKRGDDSGTADTLLGDSSPSGAEAERASAEAAFEGTHTAAATPNGPNAIGDAPSQLGRYVIGEPLGHGGMGQVFRARDPDLNRDVAIKVLHARDDGTNPARQLQQRLLREAQAMAKLSHPNLATVYDVGTSSGQVFLAMELLDGGTLKQWLADDGRDWQERLEAMLAAGRGLAAAHDAGVIHRDFKPENVLVGHAGQIKVVDFGLARAMESPWTAPTSEELEAGRGGGDDVLATPLTMTGAVMGTPAYMSPEQHRGEAATDKSDQFSFAVGVFEALFGTRPFQGANIAQIAEAIAAGTLPDPPPGSQVPPSLRLVLSRALASDPADRYPSMKALLGGLLGAIQVEAPEATTDGAGWPIIAIAGAVVLAAGIGGYVLVFGSGESEDTNKMGAMSKSLIRDVVQKHRVALGRCHTAELDRNPSIGTMTVSVTFQIAADGRVLSTRFDDESPASTDMRACIGGETLRWKFPPPEGGGRVTVKYPLVFAPRPRLLVEKIDEHTFRIPAATRKAWREDPEHYRAARLVPSVKDGKPNGVKLYAIQPRSALSQLGMVNGDTVVEVNGVRLELTPARIRKLSKTIETAKKIETQIVRRGEILRFTYLLE